MPKILNLTPEQLAERKRKQNIKSKKKNKNTPKSKANQAKQDKKRETVQITGLTKATRDLFVAKKQELGLTNEKFLVKLLN